MAICSNFISRQLLALATAALLLYAATPSQSTPSPCSPSGEKIPQRLPDARGASAFLDGVAGMSERERDSAIRTELMQGNLPAFLRNVQPVSLHTVLPDGQDVRLTLCVMADYLSIGSDADFVLIPMGMDTAMAVAMRLGFALPTRHMVDLIYRNSPVHMAPQPLPAGDQMRSTAYYRRHNALLLQQRSALGAQIGVLTAGDKKDLVLSPRLWSNPGRVAIYGWHRQAGAPIQPLSTVHGVHYADYSHGVRLVSEVVFVNGVARPLYDVLADRRLAHLLSDEGPLPNLAAQIDQAILAASGT